MANNTKKLFPNYLPKQEPVQAVQFKVEEPKSWPDCVQTNEITDISTGKVTMTYYTVENSSGEAMDLKDGDYIIMFGDEGNGNSVMSEEDFLENYDLMQPTKSADETK